MDLVSNAIRYDPLGSFAKAANGVHFADCRCGISKSLTSTLHLIKSPRPSSDFFSSSLILFSSSSFSSTPFFNYVIRLQLELQQLVEKGNAALPLFPDFLICSDVENE